MGSGASAQLPDDCSQDDVRAYAGERWNEELAAAFDAKATEGIVKKADVLAHETSKELNITDWSTIVDNAKKLEDAAAKEPPPVLDVDVSDGHGLAAARVWVVFRDEDDGRRVRLGSRGSLGGASGRRRVVWEASLRGAGRGARGPRTGRRGDAAGEIVRGGAAGGGGIVGRPAGRDPTAARIVAGEGRGAARGGSRTDPRWRRRAIASERRRRHAADGSAERRRGRSPGRRAARSRRDDAVADASETAKPAQARPSSSRARRAGTARPRRPR